MNIHIGYDIEFELLRSAEAFFALSVHPSRAPALLQPEQLRIGPGVPFESFLDAYGNVCGRAALPAGRVRFTNDAVIEDSGLPDAMDRSARQQRITDLPVEALPYLLPSRYCEVDSELGAVAWRHFGSLQDGWSKVEAVCDFVHGHLVFDYQSARPNRTALDAFRERTGVCRDFMHLAIALCRCLNLPARYATGYLGDIGVPAAPLPMDFSAWFQVYLGDRWWTFDARHNERRIGRVLMATGRDAADVALTTIFGPNSLTRFVVWTEELTSAETPLVGVSNHSRNAECGMAEAAGT